MNFSKLFSKSRRLLSVRFYLGANSGGWFSSKPQGHLIAGCLCLFLMLSSVSLLAVAEEGIDAQGYEKGKFEIKSANGLHSLRIAGQMMMDTTLVKDDGNYSGASEIQFRRARIAASGKLYKVFNYKIQFDLEDADDAGQAIEDAYLQYRGGPVKVLFGQKKTPYSMNEMTSSKYLAFLERSVASNFFNAEQLGIGGRAPGVAFAYQPQSGGVLFEVGYYALRIPGGAERRLDDGHGPTARIVFGNYSKQEGRLFHASLSGGFRKYGNDIDRTRVRPEVSEGDRLVDTNTSLSGVEEYLSLNANVAFALKRLWFNAEYFYGKFESKYSGDDKAMGFYAQGGFFLTKDSRPYKNGVWDAVKPSGPIHEGGRGAWEVALRFSTMELGNALVRTVDANNRPVSAADNQTGSTLSVALNWYPTPGTRFQFNYLKALCDSECSWGTGDPEFVAARIAFFF